MKVCRFGLIVMCSLSMVASCLNAGKQALAGEVVDKKEVSSYYVQSRGIHTLYHEQTLERKLKALLDSNKRLKYESDLSVTVYRSSVIVVGRVNQEQELQAVRDLLVLRVPKLKQKLYIDVSDKVADAVSGPKDKLLRLQIRAELLRSMGWAAGQVRVVVYQSRVYLIGPVPDDESVLAKLEQLAKKVIVVGG